jgi:hypothetical protein
MSDVPPIQQKIVQMRSGNVCAFPGCQAPLIKKAAYGTRTLVVGEMAHIISEKPDGPRGNHFLPAGEHNKYPNLMFMCLDHHTEIDKLVEKYPVELLRRMKKDHEDAVEKAVAQAKLKEQSETILPLINEVLYSTLLPVTRMPKYIFSAPCSYGDSQQKEAAKKVLVSETPYLCPFIIRNGGVLLAFNDLRQPDGPFRNIIDLSRVRISKTESWLSNPDRAKWFMSLLNRTLNKLTGRKKLQLDVLHHRYFFNADEQGKEKSVEYRPLNQSTTSRKVVWRPVRKSTNEPRNFWYHLAVNLRFVYVGQAQWCFSIRPEMRVTKDGVEPLDSEQIGSHVTRQKSHIFNYDLLEYVNFWRDYLSAGQPRITMRFGEKVGIIIPTTLMASKVQWPGIPEEFAKPFTNIDYGEDLFTSAEFQQFQTEDSEFVQEIEIESVGIEDDQGE